MIYMLVAVLIGHNGRMASERIGYYPDQVQCVEAGRLIANNKHLPDERGPWTFSCLPLAKEMFDGGE